MPTLTLRTRTATGFTTKGSALSAEEFDDNFIQLKAEIDANTAAIAAVTSHTQNEDDYLDFGGGNQVSAADLKVLLDDIPVPAAADAHSHLFVNSAGNAYEIRKKAFMSAYFVDNATETVISANNTFYDIAGTLVELNSLNCGLAGDTAISFDGGDGRKARVIIQASVAGKSAGDVDWELGCKVNAVQVPGKCKNYGNGTQNTFLMWIGIVDVDDAHVIQPTILDESGTNNAIVKHIQVDVEDIY